ncbi:phage recombinase putative [Vibrio variabilis]|uniref:Phage recombinase putative n=1 Tax=Vibrio variabilis TaxID=990271 RepID=A0ABQ0JIB0_9VIBR|nr:phage recombinase putative [Vibrio variabilis]
MKYLFEYRRVSSKKQLSGEGMEIQQIDETLRQQLCNEHDLQPYNRVFDDAGVSAFSKDITNRPAFNELLSVINQPDVSQESIVVLYNWDRLSRQDVHTAMTTLMQVTAKVRLFIVSENRLFDKSDPDLMVSLMMALVGLARAGDESAMKSKRTKGNALSLITAHQNNEPSSRNEYGHARAIHSVGSLPWWVDSKDGFIKLNEPLADTIRQIVQFAIDGWGAKRILDWLNSECTVAPPAGGHWDYGIISRLSKRKTLYGYYALNIGDTEYVLEDYVPPVIDEVTYWQYVEAKSKRTHSRASKNNVHLLTGFGVTKCRHCGGSMAGTYKGGKVRLYCITASRQSHLCEQWSCTSEPIEKAILDNIPQLLMPLSNATDNSAVEASLRLSEQRLKEAEQSMLAAPSAALARVLGQLEQEVETKRTEYEQALRETPLPIDTTIPDDFDGKRELLRRMYERIFIYRVKKFEYLITTQTKAGTFNHIYMRLGNVLKVGSMFHDVADEFAMLDTNNFFPFVASGGLELWKNMDGCFANREETYIVN